MSADWKKNAAASLLKVHANGHVCFFNPQSAKNLTAMSNVSHWNTRSGEDNLLKAAFSTWLCMRALFLTFGCRDEHFCFIEKVLLKNNLDVQCTDKTIPGKIIIGNVWVMLASYFIFWKQSEWQCRNFGWLLIIMKQKKN